MQHDDLVYVGQMVDVALKIEERAQRLDRKSYEIPTLVPKLRNLLPEK